MKIELNKVKKINALILTITFYLGLGVTPIYSQCNVSQLGANIVGESANDDSGESIALSADGNVLAIGASSNSDNGPSSGHVRVFKNISGNWVQLGSDIDGSGTNSKSGCAVALSSDGSILAIGAKKAFFNNANTGHVKVYQYVNNTWSQLGSNINGTSHGEDFGYSVDLSEDGLTVAIGGYDFHGSNGISSGHVKVFKYISGNWSQIGVDIEGDAANDYLGSSLSLSNDGLTLAVGAPENDANGSNSGHVRVYKNIAGTWTKIGTDLEGSAADDQFGHSISLSSDGSIIAIGASQISSTANNSGYVSVFKNNNGTWSQIGSRINGEGMNDQFGFTVSLSSNGTILAIGGPFNDNSFTNAGQTKIYQLTNGTWTQIVSDIEGETTNEFFGISVALNAAGNLVAVGASNYGVNGSSHGRVKVYNINCPTCDLNATLPSTPGVYTSTHSNNVGSFTCFCDVNDNLLLALDTNNSGAIIPENGVSLEIKSNTTTAWNDAGGIINNVNGGAIFNRKWNVTPTLQPQGPVKVKYFFTNLEYDSLVNRLANLSTTITSPNQLEMYKLTTNGFGDPHANGAQGTILANGSIPSLSNWVYSAHGSNHSAEFLVSSFSGGGGGAGAAGAPLPIELLEFMVRKLENNSAQLNWQTASETNNSHFEIERSVDGTNFVNIGQVNGAGNSMEPMAYNFIDESLPKVALIYYRIKQVDYNGTASFSDIRTVQLNQSTLAKPIVYPNPIQEHFTIENIDPQSTIKIYDIKGVLVYYSTQNETTRAIIKIPNLPKGIYFIKCTSGDKIETIKLVK